MLCLISSSTQSDAEKKIEGKRSRREMPSQTKVDQWYLVMSVSYVSEHLINKNLYYAWVKKNLNDKAVFYTFFGDMLKRLIKNTCL